MKWFYESLKPLILLDLQALLKKKFVFLLMVYSEKPKNVTKAIILETIDFTRLNDIFSQNSSISFNGT